MSLTGSPMDRGREEDGGASSGEPPPDNWDAQFTAIVSGISSGIQWTVADPRQESETSADAQALSELDDNAATAGFIKAPDTIWRDAIATPPVPETAEERRLRRQQRRAEREADYAAFAAAQAELAAAYEADTEHFEPPPPPPFPRPHRRTIGGILLLVLGVLILITPALLPGSLEFALIAAFIIIIGGVALIISARRHRPPRPVYDDGAEV